MPDKERRKGRRSTLLLPAPTGLEDVVEERKNKYKAWLDESSDEEDDSSDDE